MLVGLLARELRQPDRSVSLSPPPPAWLLPALRLRGPAWPWPGSFLCCPLWPPRPHWPVPPPTHHLQDSQLPSVLALQGGGQGNVNVLLLFIASSQFSDHGFEDGLIGEALQKLQRTNRHSTG